jgi:hypothetical protein
MRIILLAILAAFGTSMVHAGDAPALIKSAIFIERESYSGRPGARLIEPASTLGSGDRVVTILDWKAPSDSRGAIVSLAVPAHLAFQRSSTEDEEISVDGGRKWGKLGTLRMRDAYGARLASPEDVTNVRWRVNGPNGRITYSALVR